MTSKHDGPTGPRRTVLITGVSGVVGRAIATELRSTCKVIGLAHRDLTVPEAERVIASDLAMDRLGVSAEVWHELASEIDVIVHSGALTEWGQPWERYQTVNIDGTRRVLELAEAAHAPVHFMSTAFLHVIERGLLDTLDETNVVVPYIRSKLQAEQLLLESGLKGSIWRATNLVGNSTTGASSHPQIVERLSDWICRGKAPFLAVHAGNRIDIAPLDMLAVPVARAVETDHFGGPYWVSYGDSAMQPETAVQILKEHAHSLGRVLPPLSIVDPRDPLPVPLDQVSPISRMFVKVMIDVSEVTYGCGGILPSSLDFLQQHLGAPRAVDTESYRLSLRYWAKEAASVAGAVAV
jgi:nucleoside-diphosphate-sugar epimerase